MEYIRVTKDNLEKEHICCAISNNKNAANASLSTFRQKTLGFRLTLAVICTLTVCGCPAPLRGMDIRQIFWMPVSKIVKRRA